MPSSNIRDGVFLSTPSARRATPAFAILPSLSLFLSTPSARRATSYRKSSNSTPFNFYPRPPRGGRPFIPCIKNNLRKYFYPRPPRGGRRTPMESTTQTFAFLSTPSARRATNDYGGRGINSDISIHALREEGDFQPLLIFPPKINFYPRPPRGGRQQKQRENPLLLSHYTPPCTNCKEASANQTAKSHRYLRKPLVFRCEASGKTMCATCSHWRGIKRSAHYPAQTPGAAQHVQP